MCRGSPTRRIGSGAETDLADRAGGDLDVRQLLHRYDDPAALRVGQGEDAALAERRADLLLDVTGLERGVQGELAVRVDDADLDLHAEDLLWLFAGCAGCGPTGVRPVRRCGGSRGCP